MTTATFSEICDLYPTSSTRRSLEAAVYEGWTLSHYNTPSDDAATDITVDAAMLIIDEDPSLVYLTIAAAADDNPDAPFTRGGAVEYLADGRWLQGWLVSYDASMGARIDPGQGSTHFVDVDPTGVRQPAALKVPAENLIRLSPAEIAALPRDDARVIVKYGGDDIGVECRASAGPDGLAVDMQPCGHDIWRRFDAAGYAEPMRQHSGASLYRIATASELALRDRIHSSWLAHNIATQPRITLDLRQALIQRASLDADEVATATAACWLPMGAP